MNILRISPDYVSQIEFLSKDDSDYVLKTLFFLASGRDIKIERSLRGGLVLSIWREAVQMENKARAKKGEKWLEYDVATLWQDSCDIVGSKPATKSNQIKSNQIKSNHKLSKDNERSSAVVIVDEIHGNSEVNDMQALIKSKVNSLGLIYKSGRNERMRIQNILTRKNFGEICDSCNMSRAEFVISIIGLSAKIPFWRGKIYNAETLYKHYASVYNEAVRIKSEKKPSIDV